MSALEREKSAPLSRRSLSSAKTRSLVFVLLMLLRFWGLRLAKISKMISFGTARINEDCMTACFGRSTATITGGGTEVWTRR
jgi:hypothetical protein